MCSGMLQYQLNQTSSCIFTWNLCYLFNLSNVSLGIGWQFMVCFTMLDTGHPARKGDVFNFNFIQNFHRSCNQEQGEIINLLLSSNAQSHTYYYVAQLNLNLVNSSELDDFKITYLPGNDSSTVPLCLYETPIFTSSNVSKISSLAITRLSKKD